MIHELGLEIQAALRAKGCPFVVVDREQFKAATWVRDRIVLEHAEGGDGFANVVGQRPNPKHRVTRRIGLKFTIYAQSGFTGALEFEHRHRAEQVLDLLIVALKDVARKSRYPSNLTGGRFVTPDILEKSERFGGAVYELSFTLDRAVSARTWAGDARPQALLGGVASTTRVSAAHGPDNDANPFNVPASAETNCGA